MARQAPRRLLSDCSLAGDDVTGLSRGGGCRQTRLHWARERLQGEGGLRGGMCCSVGAVGHLCAIFNFVSKSEAELNMVFVIRCGAGGSGNGVHAVGVGLGMCVCTGGDQTACVPTLASMGTRRLESWSIIWGKKNCIISPRRVGCVRACAGVCWLRVQ